MGPDGKLCLVMARGSNYTIEYPAGHILYQSSVWIGDVRISRDGRRVDPMAWSRDAQCADLECAHNLRPGRIAEDFSYVLNEGRGPSGEELLSCGANPRWMVQGSSRSESHVCLLSPCAVKAV